MNMIDLVLVTICCDMWKVVRGMGRGLIEQRIVLCKVRLVSTWIKRRDVVTAARRIRNEEQREPQSMETFAWSFKIERVEWKEIRNAEQM